jgi:hypothetical protein
MGLITVFYKKTDEQSILCRAIALAKYGATNDITSVDVAASNESALAALIAGVTVTTQSRIVLAYGTQATYSAAGKFTNDQIASMDTRLKTANKGTSVRAGTCQSNSTGTQIKLDSGASAVTDYYKGMYVKTAGTTAVQRYITAYDGSTKICTVADTTTPITTTETFIVYTADYIDIIGNADSTTNPCRVAWTTLFPDTAPPMIISVMGGYNTGFAAYPVDNITADSATANTLVDATVFTLSADIGKYLGIISGTTGGGEVQPILSNTTTTLAVNPFRITPTGAVVYQVSDTKEWCLANHYLVYALKAYLQLTDKATDKILKRMLDKYNILQNTPTHAVGDDELVLTYCQRGKCIFDYASL